MNIEQKRNKIIRPKSIYTMSAEEQNQITSELQNLIAEGGLTPSENDLTQIKNAVKNIADQSAAAIGARTVTALGTITQTTALDTNTNYTATLSGSATFTLPTPSDTNIENTINLLLNVTASTTVDWGVNANSVLTSFTAGKYELRLRYNNSTANWIGEVLKAEATPSHTKCFVSFNENYTDQTGNVTFTPNFTPEYSDIEGFTAYEGTKSLALPRNNIGRGFTISDLNNVLTFAGPFTIKFWLRLNGNVDLNVFKGFDANSSNAFRIGQYATLVIGTTYFYPQSSVDLRSALHYIEVTRDANNVVYLFVDGVLVPRSSVSQQGISGTIKLSDSTLCFENQYDGRIYVQDFVITDQAGHTANYDVPTAPYVISDNSLPDLHDKSLAAKIADLEAEINNLKGAIMRRMDFANAVALTMSSGTYTMPSDGYLQLNYSPTTAQTYQFKLNNKNIYISNVSLMPVSKNDVLGLNSTPFNGFFIPEKSN